MTKLRRQVAWAVGGAVLLGLALYGRCRRHPSPDPDQLAIFELPEEWISQPSLSFSPDGSRFLVCSPLNPRDGAVWWWHLQVGAEPFRLTLPDGASVHDANFLPDSRHALLALGTPGRGDPPKPGGWIGLWDLQTGRELRRFQAAPRSEDLYPLALSTDGKQALCGSWRAAVIPQEEAGFVAQALLLWDVETGQVIRRLDGGNGLGYLNVAFLPDGRHALTSSLGQRVRLWDLATGAEVGRWQGERARNHRLAVSPDGVYAALAGADHDVWLLNLKTLQVDRRFKGHTCWVTCVAFSPDGRLLVSGGLDDTVRVWEVETGRQLKCYQGHNSHVESVAVAPDGKTALSASPDRTIRWWKLPE